jgi:competence protein ComEC
MMPLLWLSLAFTAGVVLGDSLPWRFSAWLWLAGLLVALLLAWRRLPEGLLRPQLRLPAVAAQLPPDLKPPVPMLLLVVFVCLGAARSAWAQPQISPAATAWYNDAPDIYELEGLVIARPVPHEGWIDLRIEMDQLRPLGQETILQVSGRVQARVQPGREWRYGDRVRLQGELRTPGGDSVESAYRQYLARQGVYSTVSVSYIQLLERDQGNPVLRLVHAVHRRALAVVYAQFPDPEASLLAGIVLGDESGIPPRVEEAFQRTGTTHVIAISGFNFALISAMLVSLASRAFGRRWGAVGAGVGILFYTVLVGAGMGVVRAALMSGIALVGHQLGRRQQGLNSLAFVAALMALANPNALWDVSFQLSFAATLGLVLYAQPFQEWFERWASGRLPASAARRLAGPVGEYFLFTLAAQVVGLPVSLYHFRHLSLSAWIANPLILPVQPPLMIIGGLSVLAGIIFPPLGQALAYAAWPFVLFTIRVVEVMAALPHGGIALGRLALPLVVCFYACLLGWTYIRARLPALRAALARRARPSLALSTLGLAALLVWRLALNAPDGHLHLTVLDVGTGEAVLVQTPSGRSLLINGGASETRLSDGLGRRLPLGQRRLDWVIVASTGSDSLAALPAVLERFPPDSVLWGGAPAPNSAAARLRRFLVGQEIALLPLQAGQVLDLGQGAELQVLSTSRGGSVLLLRWGAFQAVLPFGRNGEALEKLAPSIPSPTTALLLADGGSAGS